MKRWKLALIGIVVVLAIIIIVQNTSAVETRVLFVTVTMPRALLLLITFLIGVAVGTAMSLKNIKRPR